MVINKSKFIVFLLSAVPGVAHLYLGIPTRALTFFTLFMGVCIGGTVISTVFSSFSLLGPFLFMALVVVWFVALADACALIDNWRLMESGQAAGHPDRGIAALNNRKIIAVTLSLIPGAGHMYLGLLKQGAQLMTAFFLVMFITDWLHLGLLMFLLPVLWFYSVFDAYHLLEEETDGLRPDESPLFDWFSNHPSWIGWGLILLGVLVVLQRLVAPILINILSDDMRNYVETAIVSLILIAGGIKMLLGNKSSKNTEELS